MKRRDLGDGKKAETHERIVRTAARAIRRDGYAGVSIGEVMKEAGLTHGGFYAHFDSREAMLEEALGQAATDGLARLAQVGQAAEPAKALDAVVASYLSDRHLNAPETGCALAALGTETCRQPAEVRKAATRHVKEMADLIARQMPGWGQPGTHDDALAVMSTLVGAMVIARLVDDPALGKAIRKASAQLIHAGLAPDS